MVPASERKSRYLTATQSVTAQSQTSLLLSQAANGPLGFPKDGPMGAQNRGVPVLRTDEDRAVEPDPGGGGRTGYRSLRLRRCRVGP